jgi:hypothetical protein
MKSEVTTLMALWVDSFHANGPKNVGDRELDTWIRLLETLASNPERV